MVRAKANAAPWAATRAITAHTLVLVARISTAIPAATTPARKVTTRRKALRSSLSLNVPDTIPRKKKGAMRAAAATPTMKADSVISNTSQPTATCSMPLPTE